MYQKNLRLAVLMLVGIAFAACSDESGDSLCGNGILDAHETCDGELFADWIDVDCDASQDLYFARSRLKCTDSCELDTSSACRTGRCGNGIIEEGEECDGRTFPEIKFSCENPKLSNLICNQCRIVDRGVCDDVTDSVCGNGIIDEGELCDGRLFKEDVRVCPSGFELHDPLAFTCNADCKGIDTSLACKLVVDPGTLCGNGEIDEAVGETCDGDEMLESAIAEITCPAGMRLKKSRLTCEKCQIDSSNACVPENMVLISEVVPYFHEVQDVYDFDAIAYEISNLMTKSFDLADCALAGISSSGVLKHIALADLGLSKIEPGKSIVICDQKNEDRFEGRCTASVPSKVLLDYTLGEHLLALTCEGIGNVDIVNLNSIRAAISSGGVVFTRQCGAKPVTEWENALLGEGWTIDSSTDRAPTYGLGTHCNISDLQLTDCSYTASRTELSDRSQFIDFELLLKIEGLTDKTNKNDPLKGIIINFASGEVDDNAVHKTVHHMVESPKSDKEWTNEDGYDRYFGRLRNWDAYEGFWADEVGQFTLDAAISFDQGKTFVYCGPKGEIKNYETLDTSERNMLEVYYDDHGGVCHDGIISSSEICDGNQYRPEVLQCINPFKPVQDPNYVLAYPEKLICTCSMVSTGDACVTRASKCGNGKIDDDELCDGELIDHDEIAANCPTDTIYHPERTSCRLNCDANALASCIPPDHLTFNEFLVHYDEEGVADALAISLVLTSQTPLETTSCRLSILDKDGNSLGYIYVAELLPPADTTTVIDECRAIRFCSEPTDSLEIFDDCDTVLSGNVLIAMLPNAKTFQLSCGGLVTDVFDVEGLRVAMHQKVTHGKAKEALPWPSVYVDINDRMTLTYDADMSTIDFGKGCVPIE